MDKEKYSAIAKQISAELDLLAKKYDLSNYGFVGFVGEPGKGHVPICAHSVVKAQFKDHWHVMLSKVLFLEFTTKLAEVAGKGTYDVGV